MSRRPPSPLDRFFADLRDALLDTAEDILDDARVVFSKEFHPPTPKPTHNSSHPGKRSNRNRSNNPTSKHGRGPKTSPVASSERLGHHYNILEVSPYASQETIAAAYKSLAKKYHPDAGGDTKKMVMINVAYEILSDPDKRKVYDALIGLAR